MPLSFLFLSIQLLAGITKKGPALGFSQVFLNDLIPVAGTGFFGMGQPVFPECIFFFPFQEIKTVYPCLVNQLGQFARRQVTQFSFGMNTDPVQYFIFNYVAYTGENVLVQEGIGYQHIGKGF
jgi:hypothetical protein